MIRRLFLAIVFLAGLAGSTTPLVAQAPTADAFFDDRVLHDLHLYVNSRDMALLRQNYTANTYYTADMVWNGTRVRNVAIRSRGSGSRNPWKLGLKVDFNRYVSGRTFVGLNALVLDNLWQDPGLIRDALTMKVFSRMGQVAPRESFCRLFINHEYEGLYAMVEPIDARFLARASASRTPTCSSTTGRAISAASISATRWGRGRRFSARRRATRSPTRRSTGRFATCSSR
jgi:hypothetical protein